MPRAQHRHRLRSTIGSDGKSWKNWRLSRSRIRCWPGTESSSPTSSTDRSFANPGVVPELTRKPSLFNTFEIFDHTGRVDSMHMTFSHARPFPLKFRTESNARSKTRRILASFFIVNNYCSSQRKPPSIARTKESIHLRMPGGEILRPFS